MAYTDHKAFAIIGMAVKLPEAENYQQFWQNLATGRESVREIPDSRRLLDPAGEPGKAYARFGYLEGIDLFDPVFFKTLPAAARWIDPAQRLLLEVVNDAIEDAGYCREMWSETGVGVFVCDAAPEYYKYLSDNGLDTLAGNLPANLAGRIAYCNGFIGPALTVDTACSSGLVALHLALESLRAGDCEIAIVGGASVKIELPEKVHSSIGVMSPSGVCRPFDAAADGTVGGEGVIALVIKPLDRALADRDPVHALIRGSAINQDGSRSNGMTAPSPVAQKEVIRAAWANAEIDPETISYIETHGTATRLGDPIEITGLTDAFREVTEKQGFCPLGAVKANIGHLGNLAGLAGLVKVVLSLQARQIPPVVNFSGPNPFIDFQKAPVYVNRTLQDWNAPAPRRAGLSSFGLSGTNCHVVLEEAPVCRDAGHAGAHWIALSAPGTAQLQQTLAKLRTELEKRPELGLADLAYTLLMRPKHGTAQRFACVAENREEQLQVLVEMSGDGASVLCPPETVNSQVLEQSRRYWWTENPVLTAGTCQAVLLIPDYEPAYATYFREFSSSGLASPELLAQCAEVLDLEANPQAAYFTFAYLLAKLWMELGIQPYSVIGLGVGELVSAALSGRLSLEEALAKAAALQERAEFKAEKLHQFIAMQIAKGRNLFLHFGTDSVLAKEVQACTPAGAGVYLFSCYGEQGPAIFACTLSKLYALGMDLQWGAVLQGHRASLPLSVYQKKSYWFDVAAVRAAAVRMNQEAYGAPDVEHVALEAEGSRGSAPVTVGAEPSHGFAPVTVAAEGSRVSTSDTLSEIEQVIRGIWLERLGLENVGLDEDFIDLGGDSIRAMLLMNDIYKCYGVSIDLAFLLQYGTIAALAEKVFAELQLLGDAMLGAAANAQDSKMSAATGSALDGAMASATERAAMSMPGGVVSRATGNTLDGAIVGAGGSVPAGAMTGSKGNVSGVTRSTVETKNAAAHTSSIPGAHRDHGTNLIPHATPLRQANGVSYYALSPSQKNLWLVHQIDPEEIAYNEPMALILEGALQRDCLEQALQMLVNRHASLRTFFTMLDGEPLQGVHDRLKISIEYQEGLNASRSKEHHVVYGQPCADRVRGAATTPTIFGDEKSTEALEALVHAEAAVPFNLEHAPLIRARLVRLQEEKHLFVMIVHHIIFDGWSILVLMREICQLYEALVENRPVPLPALPLQYYDFAHWQQQLLEQGSLRKAEEYWLNKLAGERPVLDLPVDYPRPAQKSYEGSSLRFQIDPELSQGIKQLSKEQSTTLFTSMLAFFEILLYKYTRQEEFLIGTPSANRPHDSLWGLIGFFVNTFVLRHRVSRNDSYLTLLQRIKEDLLETYPYKDYPFTELVSKLSRKREPGRSALFDVMYVFHNVGSIQSEEEKVSGHYGGMTFRDLTRREIVSDYDLKIEFEETPEYLNGKIEYCTRLFTHQTIERLVEHLQQLIREVLADPTQHLQGLRMLTRREKAQLLAEWNRTEATFDEQTTVPELFLTQAALTPEQIALSWGSQQVTYREFASQALRVAEELRAMGVGPNQIVALMVERSPEMLSGIFGILLAGGAYLPLDPNYPPSRIEYMLRDSEAQVLLIHEATRQHAEPYRSRLGVVEVDTLLQEQVALTTDERRILCKATSAAQPTALAYIIYTSGSTGTPKGVMIEHRALVNRLQWMQKQYPLTLTDTILQKTAYTFDVSVWELCWWALTGAKVALLPVGGEKEPQQILDTIAAKQVTTMHFVPSMLSAFLHYLEAYPVERSKLNSLRQVFASGEGLPTRTVSQFIRLLKEPCGVALHNLYGPTEATIDVSYFDCAGEVYSETVPIGRPIDNTKLIVVDETFQLQPIGIPGEICIAGVGLARGYLNRPELTTDKFVFHPELGERVYRTGDLGRYRNDGNLEFLGRMDHQVKVRGYRIELGEIEAALAKHPAMQEVVVLAPEDETGNRSLAAFFVTRPGTLTPAGNELREELLQVLPEYMVPANFTSLPELPHLSNGKVDLKALQHYTVVKEVAAVDFTEPHTDLEKSVAEIWTRILKLPRVGLQDHFFELGGDSIKGIQVVIELSKLGFQIQLNDLLQHQTVEQLARYLKGKGVSQTEGVEAKRRQELVEGQVIPTPVQRWFFSLGMQQPGYWNQSMLLELHPAVQVHWLSIVLQKLLAHHDALRLIYHERTKTFFYHNQLLQRDLTVHTYDLSTLTPDEQDQQMSVLGVALKESIELEVGPLLQACIFDLGIRGRRLLLTVHHLVVDGISWRILLTDLNLACQQLAEGSEIHLPPKGDSYKQWAEELQKLAASAELREEIPYWNEVLKKANEFVLPQEHSGLQSSEISGSNSYIPQVSGNVRGSGTLAPRGIEKAHGNNFIPVVTGSTPLEGSWHHDRTPRTDALTQNANTYASSKYAHAALSAELTGLLCTDAHSAYNTSINDLLVTALAFTLRNWTGQRNVCLSLENHGRYPLTAEQQIERTVGWFTAMYPVSCTVVDHDLAATLKAVKETLRKVPQNGLGYGILRYMTDTLLLSSAPQILFNYLGQLDLELVDGFFTVARENSGPDQAGVNVRSCALEIVAQIVDGIFQVYFHYSSEQYRPETMEKLAQEYVQQLESVINFCTGQGNAGYTPSDFEMAGLDQETLDFLNAELNSLLEGIE